MNWELGALKILARNDTVPAVALRDTIREIERLNKCLVKLKKQLSEKSGKVERMQNLLSCCGFVICRHPNSLVLVHVEHNVIYYPEPEVRWEND